MQSTNRNIVMCFDGTTNRFGKDRITNVIRLFEILERDSEHQLCYYQAGIGTYDTNNLFNAQNNSLRSRVSKGLDAAFASGLKKHVLGGYRYLMEKYKPGDVIYMFGFSRGAYTARVLCGMLDRVGLLISGNEEQIAFAWRMYKGLLRHPEFKSDAVTEQHGEYHKEPLTHGFRSIFSRRLTVHFVGLWDTVQSTGFWHTTNLPEATDGFIEHFYHALAIDERRHKFNPLLYQSDKLYGEIANLDDSEVPQRTARKTNVHELWFAGDHSDVGGRFKWEDRGEASLSNPPFQWIVSAASSCSPERALLFDCHALLKYYDVLFNDLPEAYAHYPIPSSAWFTQDYISIDTDKWKKPEKLDFLCTFGHHFLTHQEETISHKKDIYQTTNNALKQNYGLNLWSIVQILSLKHPSGQARRVHDDFRLHHSAKKKVNEDPLYSATVKHKDSDNDKNLKTLYRSMQDSTGFLRHPHLASLKDDAIYSKHNADKAIQILSSLIQDLENDLIELMASTSSRIAELPGQKRSFMKSSLLTSLVVTNADKSALNVQMHTVFEELIALNINLGVWYRIRMERTETPESFTDLEQALLHNQRANELADGLIEFMKRALAKSSRNASENLNGRERGLHVLKAGCMSNTGCLNLSLYECDEKKRSVYLDFALENCLEAERILKDADCWNEHANLHSTSENSATSPKLDTSKILEEKFLNEVQAKLVCNLAATCLKKYELHGPSSFLDHAIRYQELALRIPNSSLKNTYIRRYRLCCYYTKRMEYNRKELISRKWQTLSEPEIIGIQIETDKENTSNLIRETLSELLADSKNPLRPPPTISELQDLFHHIYHDMLGDSTSVRMDPGIQANIDSLLTSHKIGSQLMLGRYFGYNISEIFAFNRRDKSYAEKSLIIRSDDYAKLSELGSHLFHDFLLRPFSNKEDIDQAILQQSSAKAIVLRVVDSPHVHYQLSRSYSARFIFNPTNGHLENSDISLAISELDKAMTLSRISEKSSLLVELADLIYLRWERTGQVEYLNLAIKRFKETLELSEDTLENHACLLRLGYALLMRFQIFGNTDDLKEANKNISKAFESKSGEDKENAEEEFLGIIAESSQSSGCRQVPQMPLKQIVVKVEERLISSSDRHTSQHLLHELFHLHLTDYMQCGLPSSLDEALSVALKLLSQTTSAVDDNYLCFTDLNLARLYHMRYKRQGDSKDLDLSIQRCEDACKHADKWGKIVVHSFLGELLRMRYETGENLKDMDRAVLVYEEIIPMIPNGVKSKPEILNSLGHLCYMDFAAAKGKHSVDQLRKAIHVYSEGVRLTSDVDGRKPRFLSDLAIAHLRLSLHLLNDDSRSAVRYLEQALCLLPDGHVDKLEYEADLAFVYLARFMIQRDTNFVGKAVFEIEKVLSFPISICRPGIFVCYGLLRDLLCVIRKFYGDKDTSDQRQREMATAMRELFEDFFSSRAGYLSGTHWMSSKRLLNTKELVGINISIFGNELSRQSRANSIKCITELASLLISRHKWFGDIVDINSAINIQASALQEMSDDFERSQILRGLGYAYQKRYEQTGSRDDIQNAVKAQSGAIHGRLNRSPLFDTFSELASSLSLRFEDSKDRRDINGAVHLLTYVTRNCADDLPERHKYFFELGNAFFVRFEHFQELDDVGAAISEQKMAIGSLHDNDILKRSYTNRLRIFQQRLREPEDDSTELSDSETRISLKTVSEDRRSVHLSTLPEMLIFITETCQRICEEVAGTS